MKNVWLVLLSLFCIIFLLSIITVEERVVVYDCGMAEWHPDIPKDVKEECRRRAYEYWKEKQAKKVI